VLGFEPLREIHLFMDASALRYGGGHQLIRHDWAMVQFMSRYYENLAPELGRQARLEVVAHLALDKGFITATDVALMSDFVRISAGSGGRRSRLTSPTLLRRPRRRRQKRTQPAP
jgi:hypothetical protein